jgi:hypothetical protein
MKKTTPFLEDTDRQRECKPRWSENDLRRAGGVGPRADHDSGGLPPARRLTATVLPAAAAPLHRTRLNREAALLPALLALTELLSVHLPLLTALSALLALALTLTLTLGVLLICVLTVGLLLLRGVDLLLERVELLLHR